MAGITEFAAEIDAETNRIGEDVRAVADKLDALLGRIEAGDQAAIAELRPSLDLLRTTADQLHSVASIPPDPEPTPEPDPEPTSRRR